MAPTETSIGASSSSSGRDVNDILNQAMLDATLLDIQQTSRKRPKGVLLGTYFPNFAGLFCPPLWGSRLFPLAAKQEKIYFAAAANGKLNHFDGSPDEEYIEDIQKFMKKIFTSWDTKLTTKCPEIRTTALDDYWRKKFPFASTRFYDRCFTRKEKDPNMYRPGAVKALNSPAPSHMNSNPQIGSTVVATTAAKPNVDPRRSQEALRIANVSTEFSQ